MKVIAYLRVKLFLFRLSGFQFLKDAFSPNKQYLLSIVSEIQQFPHYVKPLVVYLSENFPDYEVLGQLLTSVVDSDRDEVVSVLSRPPEISNSVRFALL